MVERGGLENRCARERTVGSNPTLSAKTRIRVLSERPGFGGSRSDMVQLRAEANPRFPSDQRFPCGHPTGARRASADGERLPSGAIAAAVSGVVREKVRYGEVPEWSNGAVSKTVDRASGPWVRIPPSPPTAARLSVRLARAVAGLRRY